MNGVKLSTIGLLLPYHEPKLEYREGKMKNPEVDTAGSEHQLYEAIAAIRTPDEAKQFLNDLCTPAELRALSDRWRVVEPVDQGVPYRTIHEQTGVSVTTIGRVARYLNMGAGGYRLIFDRLKNKK